MRRRPADRPFPIVGIGASAGGLEAFRLLLAALPTDTGMAYVLVQHLDPKHESILAELLSQSTKMPVAEVKGDVRVEPDRVYVIPASEDIGLVDGMLKLVPRSHGGRPHMPIDYFLRTLAEAQGSQGIGVVLSGTATDGTLGLLAIKAEGGIAFAQDPASAAYDGMPRSAIGAGCVDFVLPPQRIAQELTRLGRHPYMAPGAPPALPPSPPAPAREQEDKASLDKIFALLRTGSGADFGSYKKTTLGRRIARRMLVNRIETLEAYAGHLADDASEIHALYQDCLITVTSFFRDPAVFEALCEQVLPLLFDRAPDVPIRVWVPGCATGEEAYSLAICLLERAGELSRNPSLQIFASDLSESALDKARTGRYLADIAQDVSAERLQRFFTRLDGPYQIGKSVREMCVFAHHDLAKDPPFSKMDLVSCRNVLIYMEPRLQERVLRTFHYALNPGGFLVLGTSESVGASSAFLAPLDEKHRIYSRKDTAGLPRFTLAADAPRDLRPAKLAALTPRAAVPAGMATEAERVLLERYAPASVVVDEGLDVLEFRGDTHPFLEHGRGRASLNLIRMARKELLLELRQTIQRARRKNAPARKEGLRLRYRGQLRDVNLEVLPLAGAAERCLLVVFESPRAPGKRAPKSAQPSRRAAGGNRENARLRQELAEAAQSVQRVMEEHDAALEELQSSNEEAVSANEELRSVNEELQTAKEEVQSANQELATLNRELQERNVQLGQANDALKLSGEEIQRALDYANAIVATVRGPVLIMDGELRVERANRAFYETFGVRPEQTEGRLLYELGDGQWDFPGLRTALGEVLPKDSSFEGLELERVFPELGLRVMLLNARRLRNERGGSERILLAIEDRTETKRMEQGRDALLVLEQAARERAEAADHLKDEFVATVSHELRGPLTSMMGWMHILTTGAASLDAATLASGLAAIDRGIKAQARLVADLLDHARIVTGKLQISRRLVDLAEIAEAAVESVRAAAQAKDITLDLWRDPRATIVLGDPDRLQQVLWNLLSNAVKFTRRGGRVQVWAGRVGTMIHVRVTDDGLGIKADFLPFVFERFRQAESSARSRQPGLGLGLAIVRQLVELHGGTADAQSAGEGKGATFTIVLPVPALLMQPAGAEANEAGSLDLAAPAAPAPLPERNLLAGLSLLVVEDDTDSRESLVKVLEQYGARVTGAATASEAMHALGVAVPDALVSDIGMAGEDGYDLIRKVRKLPAERGGRLPALALTAFGGEGDRRKASAAGFQMHVTKPVIPAELVTEIARLAGRTGATSA